MYCTGAKKNLLTKKLKSKLKLMNTMDTCVGLNPPSWGAGIPVGDVNDIYIASRNSFKDGLLLHILLFTYINDYNKADWREMT